MYLFIFGFLRRGMTRVRACRNRRAARRTCGRMRGGGPQIPLERMAVSVQHHVPGTHPSRPRSLSCFLCNTNFIMYVTKPYRFIGFGAMYVTKPYKFIVFGDIHGPKPYKFIGFALSGQQERTSIISAAGNPHKDGTRAAPRHQSTQ